MMHKPLAGRLLVTLLGLSLLGGLFLPTARSQNVPKKNRPVKREPLSKPVAPPPPASALLKDEDWQKAPLVPVELGEIDRLIGQELRANKIDPAPLTTDEQFLRRVSLDLQGQLPMPYQIEAFVKDSDPRKRAKLVDKLLDSEEYARHWARYWREVISARLTDRRALLLGQAFEEWLFQELKSNQSWGDMARAMITASGESRYDEVDKGGAAFFLASHFGADETNERAAETSRIFLGIQIQCAQCHDHPSDQWKRVQFHELAGYFARLRSRPAKGRMAVELISLARGEHEMASKEDPKRSLVTHPRFLNGKSPGTNLTDLDRRQALADAIINKDNYWFAGAYVNRIWGVLMGQAFYQPVDDMGPKKEAVFPAVLTRLTGSFRGSNYDIKQFFRDVMNSQTYQRQIRLSDSSDQHLHFAAAYPTRLSADALWQSLGNVLGSLGPPPPAANRPKGPFAQLQGLEGMFKLEFGYDPSLKSDDIEGSVLQALFMMNNPVINQRMAASKPNLLGRILDSYANDDDALRMLYQRTLARKPTDKEIDKCRNYLKRVDNRAEAFEDILWALLNSTEFQTKR